MFYLPPNAQDDYKLPCFTGNLVLNVDPNEPDKDSLKDYAHENPIELIGKFNIINYLVKNYIGVNQKIKYNNKVIEDISYKKDIIPDVEFYTKVLKMKGVIGVDNRNQLTNRCSSIEDKTNLSGVVPNPDSSPNLSSLYPFSP